MRLWALTDSFRFKPNVIRKRIMVWGIASREILKNHTNKFYKKLIFSLLSLTKLTQIYPNKFRFQLGCVWLEIIILACEKIGSNRLKSVRVKFISNPQQQQMSVGHSYR